MEKLKVMNSRTGLRLLKAAPTARPEKPISVIGVSVMIGEIRKRVNLVIVHCDFVLTDNPLVAPLLPQTPGHLVGSVILGNLLSHDEHLARRTYFTNPLQAKSSRYGIIYSNPIQVKTSFL